MKLGAFSVSLSVKDLEASKVFYERLGFEVFHGDATQNWLIMRNDKVTIGLFQGMFEKNILTFNPGWNENASKLDSFTDVREIQKSLISHGLSLESKVEEDSSGPGSFTLEDPDGNMIMFDQHV
ncbi:VOC family protein [Halobacteriovorax sp. HLS]|uniref:VOC family protein n=1 Tax=Halobacteriovorax sp. HLS TaxID=2234000 RepID=UPI000FD87DCC|nr:VOC family protein [Halobacteriovorax sp. HLS]